MGKGVAFITGASRGIGRGIAIELARHGYDIVAGTTKADPSRRDSGVYEVQAQVEALGMHCAPVAGDIANLDDHERLMNQAVEAFGRIDLFVNNAGVAPLERKDILATDPASFDRVLDINLRGPFFLTQRVAQHLIQQHQPADHPRPKIVFITSISARTASPNRAEYCVSKAGLSMTAQNFAVRLAEYGINVYELQPGIIETDMTSAVKEKYDHLIGEGLLLQPRWGTPADVGKAVVALAEGYLDYATGAVIELGGGFGVPRL
jgi:3-oxoacyl-[acyl-carrier protein] reductase